MPANADHSIVVRPLGKLLVGPMEVKLVHCRKDLYPMVVSEVTVSKFTAVSALFSKAIAPMLRTVLGSVSVAN